MHLKLKGGRLGLQSNVDLRGTFLSPMPISMHSPRQDLSPQKQCSSNDVRADCTSDSGVNQNCTHALDPIARINKNLGEVCMFLGRFAKNSLCPLVIAMLVISPGTAIAQITPRQTEVNSVPGTAAKDLRTQTQSAVQTPSALSNSDVLIGSGDLLEVIVSRRRGIVMLCER
jgi:hypothetical protein